MAMMRKAFHHRDTADPTEVKQAFQESSEPEIAKASN
jgi:hypothetical protein